MKNILNILFVCAAGLSLTACSTSGLGDFDSAPPYTDERTATHESTIPVAPAPAPAAPTLQTCEPCADCSSWESRALKAEADLAACREASNRVRGAYTDTLKK